MQQEAGCSEAGVGLRTGGSDAVIPFCSWEPKRGKKRSCGPKSDDDGFEIVPIEDPG